LDLKIIDAFSGVYPDIFALKPDFEYLKDLHFESVPDPKPA
jgi:hypothetical protein